ncbi:MAG: inositol monophosphatase family protein [Acidimicrobiales bacterium]
MHSTGGLRPETVAAISAVKEALRLARLGAGDVHAKVGRDVVTDADVAVEDQLRDALGRAAPWPVVGEERGGEVPDAGGYWLVDPICGTRNFASGIPLFAVNTALAEGGRVSISVVGDGATGDVLVAELGRGAWRVRDDATAPVLLATSPSSLVVDFGAWPKAGSERDRAARQVAAIARADRWDVRSFATTLSLAWVAGGRIAACVLFAGPGAVHTAAGSLLVAEAGGRVTDDQGGQWSLGASSLVCAATDRLHAEILELLDSADCADSA